MLYFSYGSFMSMDVLKQHCPSAKKISTAVLPNFEVVFNYYSKNYKGGCTGAEFVPGKIAYGVLYDISEEEMLHLDQVEGVYSAKYFRQEVVIITEEGRLEKAFIYRTTNPSGPHETTRAYLGKLLVGAKENHLPDEYVEKLQRHFDSLPES
ncbi:gamma-glutamylcyclotransferase family protein [Flexilinea flocculi]|uniref:Uncharacterized conserved protein YtfP, gamma-glutamylcyclotransferase (GGCT)/AIG2-like family n=1 Tax=Flexilinea flocculi TaxID=1678840 RepID=A0A0K8P993_9CHLR|nr:gamma-glutamylcyclotransferase family protein [Flexilinea flocculi]GAP39218.1 uncharacterized conserved protein YtfP, gamma-glutamylcyclotransferase (GGCT)/AIG2-like family [Flexilinea flocculi]